MALNKLPDFYKSSDDLKYSYIRKIIYAIGAQPTPENIQALEEIAQSRDNEIRNLALHQIKKRKERGRWESTIL